MLREGRIRFLPDAVVPEQVAAPATAALPCAAAGAAVAAAAGATQPLGGVPSSAVAPTGAVRLVGSGAHAENDLGPPKPVPCCQDGTPCAHGPRWRVRLKAQRPRG
mmetsp:Transcript_72146/g.222888  ORF Transcript_72146/g.222888 Transcript_72146/m.222888 type:complete len:106 (+) Transcript_72146:155-472(+)